MLTLWHSSRYLLCYLMLSLIRCAIHLSYTSPIVFCPLLPLCCTRMKLLSARTRNANGAWIFYSDNWDQKPLRLGISPTLNFITYKDERKQHFSWYIILSVHHVYGPQQNTTQRGGGSMGNWFSYRCISLQGQTVLKDRLQMRWATRSVLLYLHQRVLGTPEEYQEVGKQGPQECQVTWLIKDLVLVCSPDLLIIKCSY